MTVTGETLGERLATTAGAYVDRTIIAARDAAVRAAGRAGRAVRQPRARRARSSSARPPTPKLFEHEGRAVVFTSLDDLAARIDDPALDVDAGRYPGAAERRPACARGMPEAGYLPIPKKLAQRRRQGHGAHLRRAHERHRLRHHRAARHARRGVRRAARPGAQRRPHPPVGEGRGGSSCWSTTPSCKRRAAASKPAREKPARGYAKLYAEEILGADEGCDFAFLRPQ